MYRDHAWLGAPLVTEILSGQGEFLGNEVTLVREMVEQLFLLKT